ncbi:MAG: hypothetical protein IJD82_11020 [Clostridia bacterium]|nr:hypothetical protein [Clostridia bacterium]
MKRIVAFVLAVIFVVALTACGVKDAKTDIFDLVEKNYDEIVAACENKDEKALLAIDGIEEVDIVDGYVLIYCMGAGIAPSSQDYGFYYSEENLPVGVFDGHIICENSALVEYENGYRYLDSGYNEFYTEHIMGNIYFYSAAF